MERSALNSLSSRIHTSASLKVSQQKFKSWAPRLSPGLLYSAASKET